MMWMWRLVASAAACGALVVRPPSAPRPPTARRGALDADGEFVAKVGLVDALRGVAVEGGDVVSAGLVAGVAIDDARLSVTLARGRADAALVAACRAAAEACRDALVAEKTLAPGAAVAVSEEEAPPPPPPPQRLPDAPRVAESLRRVRRVVAVASGKGGVGKSTVAVNLALALHARGLRVGLADVDVHGPSLPVLVGAPEDATIRLAPEVDVHGRELLEPFAKYGLKLMSFGFLAGDAPAYMRGSRVSDVVEQLVSSVAWRELDVLVVDCPPGTGDAQLTLSQVLAIDAAVVVTTPSRLSFADVVGGRAGSG